MLSQKTKPALSIAIIGAGFCGTLTAIHLLQHATDPLHIHLVNKGYPFAGGVAYNPHSPGLLLNVPNGKMSAFASRPDHYVTWLSKHPDFKNISKDELATKCSPRKYYGDYLIEIWEQAVKYKPAHIHLCLYDACADDMVQDNDRWQIVLRDQPAITANIAILATGNEAPRLPAGVPASLSKSKLYYNNPWKKACVTNTNAHHGILIIGNGLTMADTVIGLTDHGFTQTIHTVSPHGYRLQPSHEDKAPYTCIDLPALMNVKPSLLDLLITFNRHRKTALEHDQSFYPVIDALRPYNKTLWQSFTDAEKRQFITHVSTLWNTARHRLSLPMHQALHKLRSRGQLVNHAGRIVAIEEAGGLLNVILNCCGQLQTLQVQRIINCTGPQTCIKRAANRLLNNLEKRQLYKPAPSGSVFMQTRQTAARLTGKVTPNKTCLSLAACSRACAGKAPPYPN